MAAHTTVSCSLAACEARLLSHFSAAISSSSPVWIFGFGSLLFKPSGDFEHPPERATLGGWVRRFYQASPDHRGTPEYLGRVATIVPLARGSLGCAAGDPLEAAAVQQWAADEGSVHGEEQLVQGEAACVHGMAYCLEGATVGEHLARLCRREAGGYSVHSVRVALQGGRVVQAHTFVGERGGEFWAPGTPQQLADIIARARGASGDNLEYLTLCHSALAKLGVQDRYLEELVQLTQAAKARLASSGGSSGSV
jgi:cation transport protein ChaC